MKNLVIATWIFLLITPPNASAVGNMKNVEQEKVPSSNTTPRVKNIGKAKKPKKLTPEQQKALALLTVLPEQAKDIEDERLKILIQANIADALWKYDEPKARRQFTEAFHHIDSIEVPPHTHSHNHTDAVLESPRFKLRQELLQIISKHDLNLAEKLRVSINNSPESNSSEDIAANEYEQTTHSARLALSLANSNPKRAAQSFKANLSRWNFETVVGLLIAIRRENPPLADGLFSNVLVIARQRSTSLGNLGLLAYYVLPTEEERFSGQDQLTDTTRRNVTEQFLNCFYEVISSQTNIEIATAQQDYIALQMTLPLFNKVLPDKVTIVRARMDEIAKLISSKQLSAIENADRQNSVEELLKAAEASKIPQQKSSILALAATTAFRQDDIDQGLSIAEKIDNKEDRLSVISVIRHQASLKVLGKDGVEAAYSHAKEVEVIQARVDIFNRMIQKLIKIKDSLRANALLGEIEEWINKNSDIGLERVQALLNIAKTASEYNSSRFFEIMRSACKAINEAQFYALPEKTNTSKRLLRKPLIEMKDLDLQHNFVLLARSDVDKALFLAQSLVRKDASILAQVAVCQGMLNNPSINDPDK